MAITSVPRPALILGMSGLIPFAGLAVLDAVGVNSAEAALVGYGAVILSFMGGCRWGFAGAGLGEGPDWVPLGVSVVPALYAWGVVQGGLPMPGLWLAAGFVALYFADVELTARGGAPAWWPRLRLPLTVGAAGALAVGALV